MTIDIEEIDNKFKLLTRYIKDIGKGLEEIRDNADDSQFVKRKANELLKIHKFGY